MKRPMVVVAALAAGFLCAVPPAHADEPRPPYSNLPGLVPPNVATEVIATDVVIGPQAGETFAPFRIIGVQLVGRLKAKAVGEIDQDHAVAEWFFTLRFPKSGSWPPFLPEPTDPWTFSLFEMPDGGITGISVAHQGSPLYAPPSNLPGDWLQRLVPAARAAIPAEDFIAAWVPNLIDIVFSGNILVAGAEPAITDAAQGVLAQAVAGQSPDVPSLFGDPAQYFGDPGTLLGAIGGVAAELAELVEDFLADLFPCLTKIIPIGLKALGVYSSMFAAAVVESPATRLLLTDAAISFASLELVDFAGQLSGCDDFVEAASAACSAPCGVAATALAVVWLSVSGGLITASWYSTSDSLPGRILAMALWFGQQLPAIFQYFFGPL
jgi:hypothetical protein